MRPEYVRTRRPVRCLLATSDHGQFAPNPHGLVDGELSPLFEQVSGNVDCLGFTAVVGVGLERKTKSGQAFTCDGAEQFLHHHASNPVLLPAVQLH